MKVLQVTSRYPPHTGGVETHVASVAEELVARGHEVTVFAADAAGDVERRARRNGVSVRRFRALAPGDAFHVAPGIASAVRRSDAAVVHAHNYHSLPLFFAALGTRGRPFVATPHYHGGSASSLRDRLLRAYRPLGGWALRAADEVVAVSDWEREQLAADFGVDAAVVPNGLDVERFASATPRERDRPYLLCVGRLTEYKGVQHVVRALPELPEYDLLVAGSGPYLEDLRRAAADVGVTDRVEFLGYVPTEELPGLYAGAAAFVTMSRFEAYGMTVAEALASGTPCVVRTTGALRDWATRPDCVGVELDGLAEGVRDAVTRSVASGTLPTWADVTDELERRYRSLLER